MNMSELRLLCSTTDCTRSGTGRKGGERNNSTQGKRLSVHVLYRLLRDAFNCLIHLHCIVLYL